MEARLREPVTHTYGAVTAVRAAETVKHVYPTACVILQAGVTRIEEPAQMSTGKQATALLKFARRVSLIFLDGLSGSLYFRNAELLLLRNCRVMLT
jgi:hypothetical protein